MRAPLLCLLAGALAPTLARAQGGGAPPAPAPAPAASDTAAVLAVVRGLFDAMRAGDSAAVRAAFHPDARLATTLVRDGRPDLRIDSVAAFARAVGTPHAEVWDERLRDTEVRVDGPLAAVWTGYGFYTGTQFRHCGVDAIQLVRTAAGWRVLALADTRQRTGCPEQRAAGR